MSNFLFIWITHFINCKLLLLNHLLKSNKMGFKSVSVLFLGAVAFILIISVVDSAPRGEHCDCDYQPDKGGCVISRGPTQAGFKCRCRISRFVFFTHCIGTRIGCNTGETCPANCASKECCLLANGNCDGY